MPLKPSRNADALRRYVCARAVRQRRTNEIERLAALHERESERRSRAKTAVAARFGRTR